MFCFNNEAIAQPTFQNIGNRATGSFGNPSTNTNSAPNNASQENLSKIKKPKIRRDTLSSAIPDSLKSGENKIETTVESMSADSTILDIEKQIYYLYGEAQVLYGDIELKADFIKLDWGKSEVYAHGMPDRWQ